MQEKNLYKKYRSGQHWKSHPKTYAENFAEFLKSVNFDGLIVDIGCGNGRDVGVLANFGFNTFGIDNSKKEIEQNKKKFPKLKFEIQDAENLLLEDKSVDAFFMINVIHYLNKKKSMQEIFRVLNSEGYLFIHFNIEIVDKKGKIDYRQNEKDILDLVSRFKIIKQNILKRVDLKPVEHTHKILELILQKR